MFDFLKFFTALQGVFQDTKRKVLLKGVFRDSKNGTFDSGRRRYLEQMKGKAVQKMETANFEFILDIFKTLTTELPEQMLYRDNGDIIELRTVDSTEIIRHKGSEDNGWKLVGCQTVEAA